MNLSKSWVTSDLHFGHDNIYRVPFRNRDGEPIRPEFSSAKEADSVMIQKWNEIVAPFDKVYVLGDVVWDMALLHLLDDLNGNKTLVRGNHDFAKAEVFLNWFDDVRSVKEYKKHGVILSHYPIHPHSLGERYVLNVHGHTHGNNVLKETIVNNKIVMKPDGQYFNVCVEQTGYEPVNLETIFKMAKKLKEDKHGE